MSPRSDVSSLDIDIEKLSNFSFSDRPQSITGTQLSGRRSRPCSPAPRPQSRNFSLPSRPVSRSASIDTSNRGRRSSDENEKGSVRRAHSVSPEFNGPPSYTGSTNLPPFAPKTMLRDPPPVNPFSPPESAQSKKRPLRSCRSMDILEAASHTHPWTESGSISTLLEAIREKKKQRPTTFAQRVFDAGKPDLLYEFRERKRLKDRSHGVLDLTTLERMNQHVLQQKLVEQVKAIGEKGAWMEIGIRSTLHEYCKLSRSVINEQLHVLIFGRRGCTGYGIHGDLCTPRDEKRSFPLDHSQPLGVQTAGRRRSSIWRSQESCCLRPHQLDWNTRSENLSSKEGCDDF